MAKRYRRTFVRVRLLRACLAIFLCGIGIFLFIPRYPQITPSTGFTSAAMFAKVPLVLEGGAKVAEAASPPVKANTPQPQKKPQKTAQNTVEKTTIVSSAPISAQPSLVQTPAQIEPVQPVSGNPVVVPTPVASPQAHTPTPITPAKKGVTVWMDVNDWDLAVRSLEDHADHIAEVSPAWYVVNTDGSIRERAGIPVNDPRVLSVAHSQNVRLRPLIMNLNGKNFDASIVRTILAHSALRTAHATALHKLVVDNGYDGVDLDYEGLTAADFENFAPFVEELAAMLHGSGKALTVSIEARPDDALLPSWRRVGIAADSVRLMAYGQKHATPQAVVNMKTMRAHLVRALTVIPAEKLTHGIPLYCFTWSKGKVGSGTWKNILVPMQAKGVVKRDATSKAAWYTSDEKTAWCEDGQSLKNKIDIARGLGITRFALWRLGGEDPQMWDMISSL